MLGSWIIYPSLVNKACSQRSSFVAICPTTIYLASIEVKTTCCLLMCQDIKMWSNL
jgi:hypothetical protein